MVRSLAGLLCLVCVLLHATAHAADPVVIVEPQNDDVVPTKFSVKVTYGEVEYCDTGGCIPADAEIVDLLVDGMLHDQCYPCPGGEAKFDLMLDPGPHKLQAGAGAITPTEWSEIVEVTVEEDSTTSSGGDASSTGKPAEKDGCACNAAQDPAGGAVWLALLGLAISRRRLTHRHPARA